MRQALAIVLVAVSIGALAEMYPVKPHGSPGLHGQVVDADSGLPIEGVIVVATWTWLRHTEPVLFHGGGGDSAELNSLHVGEGVSNARGAFDIARWGPIMKGGGRLDDDQPRLFAFKAGYLPAGNVRPGSTLRLKAAPSDPKAYAEQISAFQQSRGGLNWRYDATAARAMPQMVLAIHEQKLRMGEEGAPILGAHLMPGKAGKGTVIDAATNRPGPGGVVWIEWTMRRSDRAKGTRQVVETKRMGAMESSSTFFVSPWRLPGPGVAGWEIDPRVEPQVRVYPFRYKRSALVRWGADGGTVAVEKIPESRDDVVAELHARRRDIDGQLALGDRAEALILQGELLSLFDAACQALTPDLRTGLCFDADSDVAKTVYALRHQKTRVEEDAGGMRVITTYGDNETAVQTSSPSPARPPPAKPVSGFTVESKK